MKKYEQLKYEERVAIRYGLYKKMSIREISRMLGRSPSTISREIKRGITVNGTYFADSTERQIRQRKLNDKRKRKMDNPIIYDYVACRLRNKQSPAIIQKDIERDIGLKIGKDAIYEYIYRFKYDEWFKYLTRKKKYNYKKNKGKKKMTIKNKVNISERPEVANQRLEFGHFEADTIFSCSGSKSALLVLVDRLTRKTHIKKLERKTASLTSSSIVVALSEYNILHIHSITYDNGCEFAGHEDVNKVLQCKSYFCNAYHSWEKGMVENINGLIRRFLPKGTNFDNITDEQIKKIENWINNRSMKILGWKSPNEIFKSVAL
jgi:IS30 family transposase